MDSAQWLQEIVVKPLEDTVRDQNQKQELKCPRCNSSNTKFCYYNNYSLTQPRYLCKACKRYWTLGGSLRNIPVGGASRRINKRSSSSYYYNKKNNVMNKLPDLVAPPALSTKAQDLNRIISDLDPPQTHISSSFSPLELLTRGFTSFMPASAQDPSSYTSGLSFLLDGIGSGSYGGGRLLVPFQDLKQAPSTASNGDRELGADHISTGGYWPW